MEIEQSASINEERKQKLKERNREYQRAWRERQKDLKKREKEEEKTGQVRVGLRARKRRKLNSNEDQKNVVQCRASQNLENVQQQLHIYEESHECITPNVILFRNTDIPCDGNCLFHSLIHVLQLKISTCDLRRQLRDSPYLNSCHNPKEACKILSSNNEYGDLDCIYLFAKIYNQNICVHFHKVNVILQNEDTRFCHFKANDTHNWIHLDLRQPHFTPYFSDDEKKKQDERTPKQKNKAYCKRYREKKKRTSNSQTGTSARDVLDVPLDDLQMKRRKLDSNEDVVQCRVSQNLENAQLEQNQFLTQQLRIYEESHECITPKVILHRNTDIPDDDSSACTEQDPLSGGIQQCRFCGDYSKDCVAVSGSMPYLAANQTTLALNHTSVQLDFNNHSLPNTVCRNCDTKLREITDFLKVVKTAQDTLINVAEERELGIEFEPVKQEVESETENTETLFIKTEYDSPHEESDTEREEGSENEDDKEGIVDSLSVGETVFVKKSVTHKRKTDAVAAKPKKIKVEKCDSELIIDIKEEVVEKEDGHGQSRSGVSDSDVNPSELGLATSALVFEMAGDGTSEYQGYRSDR